MSNAENKPVEEQAGNSAPEGAKKGKGKLIIILAVVLVLVIAGGVALGLLLFGGSGSEEAGEEQPAEVSAADELKALKDAAEKKKKEDATPAIYVDLDKFTANIRGDTLEDGSEGEGGVTVAAFSLKVDSPTTEADVKAHMPEIRNVILRLLSSRTYGELETVEGKDQLCGDILVGVNRILDPDMTKAYERQRNSMGAATGKAVTGHDVATDTSGVHEGGPTATGSTGAPSSEELEKLAAVLPVQKVIYTQFILQRG